MAATQQTWLDEGLEVLSTYGVDGLRIDRLATRLGLSKGSFYHHFGGMPGFKTALLAHYEATWTTRFIDLATEAGGDSARDRLAELQRIVVQSHDSDADIEVAIRTWASRDEDAHVALARVDAARLDFLESAWRELTDADTARLNARLTYLVLIGAQHLAPVLPADDLELLFATIAERGSEQS